MMSRKNDPLYDPIRAIISAAIDTVEWMPSKGGEEEKAINEHTEKLVKLVRISTFAVPAN